MNRILQERLSEALRAASLSAEELSARTGVPLPVLQRWLEEGGLPAGSRVKTVAEALGVSTAYLMNWDTLYPVEENEEAAHTYQIIGNIVLTEHGRIEEQFLDAYETIPKPWMMDGAPNEYFVIQAPEPGLYPAVMPGDLLFCRKAPAVDNGNIAVVLNGQAPVSIRAVTYNADGTAIRLDGAPGDSVLVTGEDLVYCHVLGHVLRAVRIFQ